MRPMLTAIAGTVTLVAAVSAYADLTQTRTSGQRPAAASTATTAPAKVRILGRVDNLYPGKPHKLRVRVHNSSDRRARLAVRVVISRSAPDACQGARWPLRFEARFTAR